MMTYFYPAVCTHDEKRKLFFVSFPDLIGCEAQGRTMEEAAKKARESLAASLLELEEKALPIPEPTADHALRLRYRKAELCTFRIDMESYRSYKEYKVQAAASQNAEWAASVRKERRSGFLARVFGLR